MPHKKVYGINVDEQSRCEHYHSPFDIVSILFKCCLKFYSCYQCHDQLTSHPIALWQPNEFDQKAILCGQCKGLLTIHQYLTCNAQCIHCQSNFNPGCRHHYQHYFEF